MRLWLDFGHAARYPRHHLMEAPDLIIRVERVSIDLER